MTELEKNRIISGNIAELLEKKQSCDERLFVHCREKMLLLKGSPIEDLPHLFQLLTKDMSENERRLCAGILADELLDNGSLQMLSGIREGKKKNVTVAMLDNGASVEALSELKSVFESCKTEIYFDFDSACRAVHDYRTDMCILPLENSSDGRLSGFYNMAVKYELFTVAVADVMNYDTSVRTRFSLLAASPVRYTEADEICCVMQFELNKRNTLSAVVATAEHFGVYCAGISSIPESHVTGDFKGVFTFEGTLRAVTAFLFYLNLISAGYLLQGIYDKI